MKIFLVPIKTVTIALLLLFFTSTLFGQIQVQHISGGSGSSTVSSLTLTLGSAPVNGNTLVAIISMRSNVGISSIAQTNVNNWQQAVFSTGSDGVTISRTEIWYASNVSGAGSDIVITFNAAGQRAAAIVIEYNGILAQNPLDKTSYATGKSKSASTGTTSTTSQSHELWIGGISLYSTYWFLTDPTNYFSEVAPVVEAATIKLYALERIVTEIGEAYTGGSIGATLLWTGAIATFKAVPHWTGATDAQWNDPTNWDPEVLPTAETNVVIPLVTNLPEVNITDAVCNNLTIKSGASLTINPGQALTVNGNLYNLGTLNLNSTSASAIFSLMMDSYSGSGTTNAQLYLTGGGSPMYNWHYVAVPFIDGLLKTPFIDFNNDGTVDNNNLQGYDESRVTTNSINGWYWHNGQAHGVLEAYSTPLSTLTYGIGYNYYNSATRTITLSAATSLGTSLGTASLISSADDALHGFNLLGNSLTCSIDINAIEFGASVGHTVYFTTGNTWVAYLEGASGNTAARYIPPLQGFFVKAQANSSIDFTDTDNERIKVHQSDQGRYKKSGSEQAESKEEVIYPKVKLELNDASTSDETTVWFNSEATAGFDLSYDGYKLFSSETGQLYSTLNGAKLVFNGLPLPVDSTIVPLGISIAEAGNYSILKKVLEELENFSVYLIDKANGNFTIDLKKVDKYDFISDAGTFDDRFVLKFASLTTSAEAPKILNKNFNIYGTKSFINILPADGFAGGSDGVVKIYDLTGRIIKQVKNIGMYEGTLVQIPFTGRQGVYIVEITSGISRFKGKVSVK